MTAINQSYVESKAHVQKKMAETHAHVYLDGKTIQQHHLVARTAMNAMMMSVVQKATQ